MENGAERGVDEESVGNPDAVKVWPDDFLTPGARQKLQNIAKILRDEDKTARSGITIFLIFCQPATLPVFFF